MCLQSKYCLSGAPVVMCVCPRLCGGGLCLAADRGACYWYQALAAGVWHESSGVLALCLCVGLPVVLCLLCAPHSTLYCLSRPHLHQCSQSTCLHLHIVLLWFCGHPLDIHVFIPVHVSSDCLRPSILPQLLLGICLFDGGLHTGAIRRGLGS